jgi:CRP-like cAMP-binding protein
VIAELESHARLEVGIVGDEGMLGASLVLGVNVSPLHAVVQGAGPAWRLSAAAFRTELSRSASLRVILQRYIYVLMGHFAQAAICIRYHVVEARLARWLLMTRDRAHSRQFFLTHEFLADMLGVRRVGITTAAKSLARRKVLNYSRGSITILDDAALEAASCGCYEREKAIHREILSVQGRTTESGVRKSTASVRAGQRGK